MSFANSVGNNGSGGLTLINSGSPATLTLAAGNSYSGTTNINAGTLLVSNPSGSGSGSATGSGPVNVYSGATLAGSGVASQGFISGNVTVAGSATISPSGGGVAASSTSGVLSLGGLTLTGGGVAASGAQLNYQVSPTDPSSLDSITLANTGTLTLPSGGTYAQFNFYQTGTTNAYMLIPGDTYTLINFGSASVVGGGSNIGTLSVNQNDLPSGDTATFSTASGDSLTVTVLINTASGTWSSSGTSGISMLWGNTDNWSNTVGYPAYPNGAGQTATFGTGSQEDINIGTGLNYTVGSLMFNNGSPPYTVGFDGTGSLTLNNNGASNGIGGFGAIVSVSNGATPSIGTALALADSSTTTTFNIDGSTDSTLDITGAIGGSATDHRPHRRRHARIRQ